jgi:hypothetical protein
MDPGNPAVLYACGPIGVYKTFTGAESEGRLYFSAVLNDAPVGMPDTQRTLSGFVDLLGLWAFSTS